MSSINERVKEVRQYLGMNQKNFSNEIGISPSHMSSIENGKDKVTYVKVTVDKAKDIVEKHLIGGKIVTEYTLSSAKL